MGKHRKAFAEISRISAFENCYALEFVSLPDSLTVIGGAAFAECVSVNKLIFSDTSLLKKIGDHAFRGCRNLKEVYLPDSVEYVGSQCIQRL